MALIDSVTIQALEVYTAIEGEHYMEWTRLEEVMGYARGMGYRKIGIAHCVGLTREGRVLKDILFTQHSKAP